MIFYFSSRVSDVSLTLIRIVVRSRRVQEFRQKFLKERREKMSEQVFVEERYDLSLEAQKLILQVCWAQHDAQWFLKTMKKHGSEEANRMNHEVIFSMGKIEARHAMNALNIKKDEIRSIPDIFKTMNTFMHIFFPAVMKFKMVVHTDREGSGIVDKCYIWEEVKKSKGEAEYVCSCNARHRGWLAATGVEGRIEPIQLIPRGDKCCEFSFRLI